ncbi:iron-sulfur cluster carrier protein ApbC [Endozoicomonas sp. SCSIO W0465]|uniref:iron-sulfur cluster carrier protein ApbC n=1 Tax=Endozoicomonas sp. SCSIO W0465 TaxID=2918516 RepID=UPI002074B85E|nr:iron-sulfur cluster carrier protein ApbC [Endozoicomonas sp. SCSIO W0465]USE38521.1 iron-sulfur cluster carrier protein ApbC [Endozoicomonas sp. SCSIO W0465]
MNPSRAAIEAAIRSYQDPYLNNNLLDTGCLESLDINNGKVSASLMLGYPAKGLCDGVAQMLANKIDNIDGVESVDVSVNWNVAPAPVQGELETMAGVKNIIAVASGKGGVGKSTTAANLALALAAEGARAGVLDADIYGPSMGQMFGIPDGTRPDVKNDRFFMPIEAHGIQVMSMAFLVTEDTPVVWRGPMVSGALIQLLTQTLWNDLDYLVIDLPPGTGDIQLTLAQKIPVSGSVVVTTPQDLALIDAKKGIEMFRKVGVPVLGVVENMAVHICSNCGHAEHLFGEGGGSRIAEQFDIDLLGSLPLSMMIREQADQGTPTVVSEPESQIAMVYRDMARHMAAKLWLRHQQAPAVPSLSVVDD